MQLTGDALTLLGGPLALAALGLGEMQRGASPVADDRRQAERRGRRRRDVKLQTERAAVRECSTRRPFGTTGRPAGVSAARMVCAVRRHGGGDRRWLLRLQGRPIAAGRGQARRRRLVPTQTGFPRSRGRSPTLARMHDRSAIDAHALQCGDQIVHRKVRQAMDGCRGVSPPRPSSPGPASSLEAGAITPAGRVHRRDGFRNGLAYARRRLRPRAISAWVSGRRASARARGRCAGRRTRR